MTFCNCNTKLIMYLNLTPFIMTRLQKTIANQLESLAGHRFTIETLEAKLSQIFNEAITVEDITDENDGSGSSDFNLLFQSVHEATYGFFDLYFLKTREDGIIYVTEVAYEWE